MPTEAERLRLRRQRLRAAGMCQQCGQLPVDRYTKCFHCRSVHRELNRAWYRRKRKVLHRP